MLHRYNDVSLTLRLSQTSAWRSSSVKFRYKRIVVSFKMCSEALDWLTIEFVEKVLKKSECDQSIKVKDLTKEPAVGKGDNFGSEMIRANVKYSYSEASDEVMKTISIVAKIAPMVEGVNKELIANFEAFNTEINMMQTTLTQMNEILNEKNFRLSPRVLYTEIGDPSFIVMEDLAPLGYRMADRMVGADLEHCLLAMRNLAKFHASSVALCEKDPKLQTLYRKGLFDSDYPDHWKQFFVGGMDTLAKELLDWTELGADRHSYSEKFFKLSAVCYGKAVECVHQKGCEFNVLNHGDCWLNNMLFRYDDSGKLTDHIFVDFQLSLWNSPAIDIINFLITTPSDDVDLHHRETLLTEYLNTLIKTMLRLHCKTVPPTMEGLMKTLQDYEFYDVIMSCLFLPLVFLDKSQSVSFDDMQLDGSEQFVNPAYKGQAFRRRMLRRLPVWNVHGSLDV